MRRSLLTFLLIVFALFSQAQDTISFMSYNLLNYPGSTAATRNPSFRTIMADANPDILVVQEISQPVGFTDFLSNVLNFSSAIYTAGTFVDGPDSDNGIYYKAGKYSFISNTPIATALRDISEFKLRHLASGDTLVIYSVHLKSSNSNADELARAAETDSLRKVTNQHIASRNFLVCGDFNIYKSSEQCYINLTQTGANNNGKFNDVISMTGTWNNASYAAYHTQSPRTTSFGGGASGGLDDRFDLILFSNAIYNAGGLDIVTGSYKAYGNDGAHYNLALNTGPFTTYSQTLSTALHDVSDHIPVMVNMVYNSPLPVKMLYFKGSIEQRTPILKWATASESNAAAFIIQRSSDGKKWEDIDRVKAAGNSQVKQEYQYKDRSFQPDGNTSIYYRLKQTDFDETEAFSNIINLSLSLKLENELTVFPNPSTSVFYLKTQTPLSSKTIRLIDLNGKTAHTFSSAFYNEEITTLDLSDVAPGIYYLEMEGYEGRQKIVKL